MRFRPSSSHMCTLPIVNILFCFSREFWKVFKKRDSTFEWNFRHPTRTARFPSRSSKSVTRDTHHAFTQRSDSIDSHVLLQCRAFWHIDSVRVDINPQSIQGFPGPESLSAVLLIINASTRPFKWCSRYFRHTRPHFEINLRINQWHIYRAAFMKPFWLGLYSSSSKRWFCRSSLLWWSTSYNIPKRRYPSTSTRFSLYFGDSLGCFFFFWKLLWVWIRRIWRSKCTFNKSL
jgi:hypothetical protein